MECCPVRVPQGRDSKGIPHHQKALRPLLVAPLQVTTSDLHHIIPLVAFLIAILLALVLRSLIAPVYLVASVVLSYLAALGLVSIVFVDLGGHPSSLSLEAAGRGAFPIGRHSAASSSS